MEIGDSFSQEFIATETLYQGFVELFKDTNPMHTNKDFAISKGFPGVILHGNILGGFLSYFIGECLPIKNVMIIGQKIDYHQPFFVSDKLNLVAKIKYISEATGVVDFKFSFNNQKNKKVAKGTIQIKLL